MKCSNPVICSSEELNQWHDSKVGMDETLCRVFCMHLFVIVKVLKL